MSPVSGGALRALLAALLFGVSTPIAKILLDGVAPVLLAGLLYLGGSLAMAPSLWQRAREGRPVLPSDRANRLRLAGAVFLGGSVAPVLVFLALVHARAASVAILLNLETVATAVLGLLMFKEHLGRFAAAGNLLVFAAGILLAFEGGFDEWLPALAIAVAALCWGFDNHLTASIDGIRPQESTFFKGIVAGTVNVAVGLALGGETILTTERLCGSLLLGALAYGVSIVFYIQSAQALGATRSQMLFASAPFFGVLGAVVALGESISAAQGGALALLVAGNAVLIWERHAEDRKHERPPRETAYQRRLPVASL